MSAKASDLLLLCVLTLIGGYLLLVHVAEVAPLPAAIIALIGSSIVFVTVKRRRADT